MIPHAAAASALAAGLLLASHPALADAAAGARLAAARCVSCHASAAATHATVPLLEGQPKGAFIAQWRSFRDKVRTAPIMVALAAELSERDVEDLAEHYASLSPFPTPPAPGSETGRAIAERLRCASCHGAALQGLDDGVARLAGQKPRYIAWALQSMRSGTRAHGPGAKPDPVLAALSNADIEALAAYFGSLR